MVFQHTFFIFKRKSLFKSAKWFVLMQFLKGTSEGFMENKIDD